MVFDNILILNNGLGQVDGNPLPTILINPPFNDPPNGVVLTLPRTST